MQSHDNRGHLPNRELLEEILGENKEGYNSKTFTNRLKERAKEHVEDGTSRIASGGPEETIDEMKLSEGFGVKKLPDDEQGILRISIGGGPHLPVEANYLSYRGDKQMCIDLLTEALVALNKS